mmetsp:Transcript_431/g.1265  ORF Transcript_431/g.1265 Transcript_431/m.1265 type:complete len:219 (-) Transcript_431:324-980(-)
MRAPCSVAASSSRRVRKCLPVSKACCCRPSRSMTSRTARPAAHATGFPPNVLKYSWPFAKEAAISSVHTTAANGKPLPNGLPMVTMSGVTPCCSNPQKCSPSRPKPTCTSSATHTPPLPRTRAYICSRYELGGTTTPATDMPDSMKKAASSWPSSSSPLIADLTCSAMRVANDASDSPARLALYPSGQGATRTCAGLPVPPLPKNLYGLISIVAQVLP